MEVASRVTPARAAAQCFGTMVACPKLPEVDRDQLAGLRRLRVASGPIEIVEIVRHDQVVSNDPEDYWAGPQGRLARGEDSGLRGG